MYFWIQDDGLLEKYNTIWDKISAGITTKFDSEPVYNKNVLKSFSINYLGLCFWEIGQLLSASVFKRM